MMKIKLLFVLLALVPALFYHLKNDNYPSDDAGAYMVVSQQNYYRFTQMSFLDGIHSTFIRGRYKPILHPIIGTGLMLLNGGNSRLTIKIYCIFFTAVFLWAIFSTLQLFCDSIFCGIGTLSAGFLPWVMQSSFVYNAEIALLASSSCAIYFYLKFCREQNTKLFFYFHLFYVLTFMFRPLEGGIFLFPLEISMLLQSNLARKQLVSMMILFAECIIILAIPYLALNRSYNEIEFSICLVVIGIRTFLALREKKSVLSITVISLVLCTLFVLPQSWALLFWILDTSLGVSVQKVATSSRSTIEYLIYLLRFCGVYPIVGSVMYFYFRKKQKYKMQDGLLVLWFCGFFFLLFGFFSKTNDTRYFIQNFVLFFLLFFICLQNFLQKSISNLCRYTIGTIIFLAILCNSFNQTYSNEASDKNTSFLKRLFGESYFVSMGVKDSVLERYLNDLQSILGENKLILQYSTSTYLLGALNSFGVSLKSCEKKSNLVVHSYSEREYNANVLRSTIQDYDAFLVGPIMRINYSEIAWLPVGTGQFLKDITAENPPKEFGDWKREKIKLQIDGNDFDFILIRNAGKRKEKNLRLACA